MKIGIDCDGVLRDFIGDLKDNIKENYPEHADKINLLSDIPTHQETKQLVLVISSNIFLSYLLLI